MWSIQKLVSEIQDNFNEIQRIYNEELEALQDKFNRINDANSYLIDENARLEKIVEDLNGECQKLTDNIEELEYRIAERDSIIEKLQKELDNYILNRI